jgi:acyl dehydratase
MTMDELYFEDLPVGRTFTSGSLVITEAEIIAFARQFDPQFFHTDPEAAKTSLFKGLAASGWHTAGLSMRLLTAGHMPIAGGLIGAGVDQLDWPRPVRPGDRLRVETEVIEARRSVTRPSQGWVKMRNITLNQLDQPVQIFVPRMPVPVRGG